MKRLQASGLETQHRKAEVISYESEDIMWEKGVLGDGNPQAVRYESVYEWLIFCIARWTKTQATAV